MYDRIAINRFLDRRSELHAGQASHSDRRELIASFVKTQSPTMY